jgi:hypothetical protein
MFVKIFFTVLSKIMRSYTHLQSVKSFEKGHVVMIVRNLVCAGDSHCYYFTYTTISLDFLLL